MQQSIQRCFFKIHIEADDKFKFCEKCETLPKITNDDATLKQKYKQAHQLTGSESTGATLRSTHLIEI